MPTEFEGSDEIHYVGFYNGVVTDNADPEGVGRVRFRIDGFIEPEGAWAFPIGTPGSGSPQRGFYDPPDIGADVGILFLQGDENVPVYFTGHWGVVNAKSEVPGPAQNLKGADAVKVKAYETDRFQMVWDNRAGGVQWFILDKTTGDIVKMDENAGLQLQTAKDMQLQATGDLVATAAEIRLNGSTPVGRIGDTVEVTIPSGTFHITNPVQPGPPTIPNPLPVTVPGTITSGSGTVKAG